jgi:site-specific DNA-methyltransferase (adenine-specific)
MLEINKIYQGDCLEVMKEIPDGSIDMILTSPPYDNLREYKGYSFDFEGIARELYRIVKDGGVVVWVVGDQTINGSESGTSFKQALYFKEIGFNLHDTMIYQKDNPPPVGGTRRYFQHFEYMFVFSKGAPVFNPRCSERRNKWNDKRVSRYKAFVRDKAGNFRKKTVSLVGEVKRGNIWKYVVGGGNSVPYGIKHPATFPEKLAEDHILSWSNEGDTILDPMAGSGTTLKMAKKNNRNYIGIEISAEYCKIAEERLL